MAKSKQIVTEYRYYDLPLEFPVLLLTGERWHISDIKSDRLHFHNHLEIGICFEQSGFMEFESTPLPFQAGDITCIPRNLPHTTYSSPGEASLWKYLYLDTDTLFRGLVRQSEQLLDLSMTDIPNFRYILNRESYPKIYFLASSIMEEMETKPENYQASVRALSFALCLEIIRIQKAVIPPPLHQPTELLMPDNSLHIAPALDYISKHYMHEFTVEDLAEICHLSPTHFRRLFHATTNTSPLDFINNTRIYQACILLKGTEESVLYISEQVGFRSVSSFNRCFAKAMGASPRDWRKNVLFSEGKAERGAIMGYPGWI